MIAIEEMSLNQMFGQMVMAQLFGVFSSKDSPKYAMLSSLIIDHHIENFKLYHGYALGTLMLLTNLQKQADTNLLIAADVEEGVGQQIVDIPRCKKYFNSIKRPRDHCSNDFTRVFSPRGIIKHIIRRGPTKIRNKNVHY